MKIETKTVRAVNVLGWCEKCQCEHSFELSGEIPQGARIDKASIWVNGVEHELATRPQVTVDYGTDHQPEVSP